MDRIFQALASQPRRKILAYLSAGELTAGDIADRFEFTKPALSGHLRLLEDAGLIAREKRGQFTFFRLVPDRLANTLFDWVSELCPVTAPIKRERKASNSKQALPARPHRKAP